MTVGSGTGRSFVSFFAFGIGSAMNREFHLSDKEEEKNAVFEVMCSLAGGAWNSREV